MLKSMFKKNGILLTLAITSSFSFVSSFALPSYSISNSSKHLTASLSKSPSLKQRRPRTRLGARGDASICAISPGLLERQNIIWSDRPLFLWSTSPKVILQQLEVIDQSGKILWQKPLAAAAQGALYEGQPLQPGRFYTWRLQWVLQNDERTADDINERTADYTFELMESEQQRQITTELQALARQLNGAGAETIANLQADYLTNRSEPLWSDALRILYTVENPSRQTTQKLQSWINAACGQEEN